MSLFELKMMHSNIFTIQKYSAASTAKTKRKFYDPPINQRHLLPQKKYTNMTSLIR